MKNELVQDLSGLLIIYMQISLGMEMGREKQVTIARVHCTRKNAEMEFAKFKDLNIGNFHAEFNFNSDFIH